MRHSESPLVNASMLLAIYARSVSRNLIAKNLNRTAGQLEGAALSVRNNVAEAQSPESRRDFIHKLKIAHKELIEAEGILATLTQAEGLTAAQKETLMLLCDSIGRLLSSSIATAIRNSRSSHH